MDDDALIMKGSRCQASEARNLNDRLPAQGGSRGSRLPTDAAVVSMRPAAIAMLVGALIVALPYVSHAQAADPEASVMSRDATGRLVIHATRIATPLEIDGRLNEEVYSRVPSITGFVQQVPDNGQPATERTEMWILFDDDNVYVACRFWDTHPERIVATEMRRDQGMGQDRCDSSFDTMNDKRSNYVFYVNALGGIRDGIATDESPNFDWNGVLDASAARTDWGWSAEMAIPFKTLRYQPGRQQTWGVILRRLMGYKNEHVYLVPMSPARGQAAINQMSEAAVLVGIEAPPGGRNLDIKPYAISRLSTDRVVTPNVRNDFDPDGGIDVRYGVTEGLTGSFSYRTDFAEAEADDAQVNLSRFSLFFPEKREFFLEGEGLFDFGALAGAGAGGDSSGIAPTLFYSRRIGLSGSSVVPVIGGARLAGRAGAWSIGALDMVSGEDERTRTPRTNFSVVRLRHDFLRRSSIGAIMTHRSASVASPGSGNTVAGLDVSLAFFENVSFTTYYAQSETERLEGDAGSYRAIFNYGSDRYGVQLDRNVIGANFNPEVGFVRRPDARRNYALFRFSPRPRGNRVVRQYTYQGSIDYITDNRNRLETRLQNLRFETEFHNGDSITAEGVSSFEFLDRPFRISRLVTLPAGGYQFENISLSYARGQQQRINGTVKLEAGSFYSGTKQTVEFNGRASVLPQLSVSPRISLNRVRLAEGEFTSSVFGANTVYSATPRQFVSALVQYSSEAGSISANVRYRWEYSPGSELFVVYTEGRSTLAPSGLPLQSRGIVVKMNRLFRM